MLNHVYTLHDSVQRHAQSYTIYTGIQSYSSLFSAIKVNYGHCIYTIMITAYYY